LIRIAKKQGNNTWVLKLERLKKARSLVQKSNPSDEDLKSLLSDGGPGMSLACAAVKALRWHNDQPSHDSTFRPEVDYERFFETVVRNPFVDLQDEVEVT